MTISNRSRLVALSEKLFRSEYRAKRAAPAKRRFKPMNVSLAKYDDAWDRRRGAAVRMSAVLLRDGYDALVGRIGDDPASVRTFADVAQWLAREADMLRRTARLHEIAASRVGAILTKRVSGADLGSR